MNQFYVAKWTAESDKKIEPENMYAYVRTHGVRDNMDYLLRFANLKDALEELSNLESRCEKKDGVYHLTIYSLEHLEN